MRCSVPVFLAVCASTYAFNLPKGPSTPPRPLSADSRASRSAALTSAARPTRGSVALSFFPQTSDQGSDASHMMAIREHDLLTKEEELELAADVQMAMRLQRISEELEEANGMSPSVGEWARAAGMSYDKLLLLIRKGNKSKDRLVTANLRLVNLVVNKLYSRTRALTHNDLMQEGSLGLIRAAEKFDGERGTTFATYAMWWIRAATLRAIQDHDDIIRLPVSQHEKLGKVTSMRRQLSLQHGSEPSHAQLASALDVTEKELRRCLDLLDQKTNMASLDGSAYVASRAAQALDSDDSVSRADLRADISRVLAQNLRPQELQALQLRFGLDGQTVDGRSMAEVGLIMHLSKERIRQIVKSALSKLAENPDDLEDYLGLCV